MTSKTIEKQYQQARNQYRDELGVDTEKALNALRAVPVALHCWQGDDVGGFERPDAALAGGGIQVTGNYPGRARTPEQLRADMTRAFSLIPGPHRANIHAIYGEFGGKKVDRDQIEPKHFEGWITWAREAGYALDFNTSAFSHPMAASGFTLSHPDAGIRKFWIAHVQRCREITAHIGRSLKKTSVHNLWIPDGGKDDTALKWAYRARLKESLDTIFTGWRSPKEMKDAVEGKLFGIGSESFVVGSNDFYLAYAVKNGIMPCLDMGHYHPTESVADKVSAVLQICPAILVHVSRGVRWDSDHVVILNDELRALMQEIARVPGPGRVHLALDYFDASLNRVGAWVVGARATNKALLLALLDPIDRMRAFESDGNQFGRLALQEAAKTMPFGAVWDYYCLSSGVPGSEPEVIRQVLDYEAKVLSKRG